MGYENSLYRSLLLHVNLEISMVKEKLKRENYYNDHKWATVCDKTK
jgi:hypothetical protein